ncbi:MAG: hypothetical protein ACI3XL_02260 [Eubacteriales bacterium]
MDYNNNCNGEYNSADYAFCQPYFTSDEYVVWRGRPSKKRAPEDFVMMPFGLFFAGFAIFWTIMAFTLTGSLVGLFGLLFIAVGLYVMFGARITRRKTFYVITNHKIYRSIFGRVDMVDLANLPPMRVVANKNGTGSILFGEYHYHSGKHTHTGLVLSIDNIDDVASVQRIISDML